MVSRPRPTTPGPDPDTGDAVERVASRILLWGGLVGIAVVLLGSLLQVGAMAAHHGGGPTLDQVLRTNPGAPPPGVFVSVGQTARALRPGPGFDPLAVVALGIGLLLLTPVAGVTLTIPGFLAAGDVRYALIAGTVLAILVLSFWVGGGGG